MVCAGYDSREKRVIFRETSEGARPVVGNGRLGTTADWGFFLVGKVMGRGGMGETQLLEGRKGLGPNVVLVLILVRILVLFLKLVLVVVPSQVRVPVLDVVLVLVLVLQLVVVLVPIQVLVPVLDLGLVAGLELRA